MGRTTILVAAAFVAAAMPIAAAADPYCTPVQDRTATTIETPAATFYVKTSSVSAPRGLVDVPVPTQVWRETNDLPGLQPTPFFACDGPADDQQFFFAF